MDGLPYYVVQRNMDYLEPVGNDQHQWMLNIIQDIKLEQMTFGKLRGYLEFAFRAGSSAGSTRKASAHIGTIW